MKIFFDHNISHALPEALQAIFPDEHEIVALEKKFPRTISDIDWIAALSSEGHWIVISGDLRITRNRAERQAFRSSKLTGFFMAPALKKARVIKQLERLCALWDNIVLLSTAAAPGALYELPMKTPSPRQLKL